MPSRRKRSKYLNWLYRLLSPKSEIFYTPDGGVSMAAWSDTDCHRPKVPPARLAQLASLGGNNTVTYVQGDRNLVSHVMGLLQQQSICGAAHDSSARSPPPRCHPKTRVKLIARITTWFEGQGSQELVLWITGPAGVGKSAVVQTFAEHLVKFELLGASVFFSQPNQRNNPHGVFITIAYQLATRIEAYRNFVVERLCHDPELISGDMEAQFRTFIIEPFVGKKIGAGGKRWGILLDGLDELKGEDAQCEIIRLVTTFAHEHPDVPLAWIIASHPESHICDTFADDDLPRSYWSEDIPIDSTEACKDINHFLRSEFDTIQKKFRRSMPRDWPSDTDYLKLTAAASGLFVYAQVVMQFIRDPGHSDPASQFKTLLSIIDRVTPTKENPFVHLDMLYREILSFIPLNLWPTTKRLLCCVIYLDNFMFNETRVLQTLQGMSILLGLSCHAIYTCLLKCQSILRVPDWKDAHKQNLTFLHASFTDYLKDARRSENFYVGSEEDAVNEVDLGILAVLNVCSREDAVTVETAWRSYCSSLDDEPLSRPVMKYHANVLCNMASSFAQRISFISRAKADSSIYAQLCNVHMIKASYYFNPGVVFNFVLNLRGARFEDTGLFRRAKLKDLKFGHLDWKMMSPTRVWGFLPVIGNFHWVMHRPRSKTALKKFVSELESLAESWPELKVVIFGGVPKGRIAVFSLDHNQKNGHSMDYMIPYPE